MLRTYGTSPHDETSLHGVTLGFTASSPTSTGYLSRRKCCTSRLVMCPPLNHAEKQLTRSNRDKLDPRIYAVLAIGLKQVAPQYFTHSTNGQRPQEIRQRPFETLPRRFRLDLFSLCSDCSVYIATVGAIHSSMFRRLPAAATAAVRASRADC